MRRLLPCLLVILLIMAAPGPGRAAAVQRTVSALGTAPVDKSGGGDAQDAAVTHALRSAVFQALESIVGPKRLNTALSALAAPVLENPAAYFDGYTVSSRVETDKRLFVVVSGRLNDASLKAALASLGLGRTDVKVKLLPMMLTQHGSEVPFAWWHSPGLPPPNSPAMDALLTRLTDLGVSILPQQSVEALEVAAEPEPEAAAKTGRALGAELVLLGWMVELQTDNGPAVRASCWVVDSASGAVVVGPLDLAVPDAQGEDYKTSALENPSPATAETVAPAIAGATAAATETAPGQAETQSAEASAAQSAATASSSASPPVENAPATAPKPAPTAEAADQSPAETNGLTQAGPDGLPLPPGQSLETPLPVRPDWTVLNDPEAWPQPVPAAEAGKRLADLLAKGIQAAGWVLPVKPREITLEVSGITRYLDLKTFLGGLDRLPDKIQEVRQQSIRAGKATFRGRLTTTPENLGELLSGMEFPTFFTTVEEVGPEVIKITLVPK